MRRRGGQILYALVRGESITKIVRELRASYGKVRSRRAFAELDRKGGTALDAARGQNYMVSTRVVD
jgi:hypothetical protein